MGGVILDLSTPATLTVRSPEGKTDVYTVAAHFSDLPVIYLTSPQPVVSRSQWITGCRMQICHAGTADRSYEAVELRGRGNSTWSKPKKPYAIRLGRRASVLGLPEHKRWVLLANYLDHTQMRSELGFFIGRLTTLPYTPRTAFAEVVMNGDFLGTYQLAEHIKVDENRLNIPPESFLLETDSRATAAAGDVFFRVDHIPYPVVIKNPDTAPGQPAYTRVAEYVQAADRALFGPDFRDPDKGYRAWIDVESFAEWYLVNEITKNNDACFFASCFMHLAPGGKLRMGPLWDFDLAFGNVTYNDNERPEGFWIKRQTAWFARLFEDPAFVELVRERFAWFDSHRELIYHQTERLADRLATPVTGDNGVWGHYEGGADATTVLPQWHADTYRLRQWLDTRLDWMGEALSGL